MPVITDIQPQKKRQGYYNIFIDGKYTLSLTEDDIVSFQLKPEQIIDDNLLSDIHQAYVASKCYNYSLRYLAVRPRSINEVREYLVRRKGFDEDEVNQAIQTLLEKRYLDDNDFARIWIRNRMQLSQKPLSMIRLELLKKGVDKDVISACINDVEEDEQLEVLKTLIIKKIRIPKFRDKQKLTDFLARRGYSYSLIQKAFVELALFED